MNLTGITEVNEVYLKHFYDSLLASLMFKDIHKCESLCDVGSGAGFPALPVKIVYPHLKMDLVDSLGKRVNFLNHVIAEQSFKISRLIIHVLKNMQINIVNRLIL